MSDTPTRILTAATRCIARSGVRGMRVGEVAREAGVSPALLYYHFTDRAGLLAATLDHINSVSTRDVADRPTGDPAERLRALLLGEIVDDAEVRETSAAWNELRSSAVFEPELAVSVAQTTAAWNRTVAEAARAAGVDDPEAGAEILTGLVEGLSTRWLSDSLSTDRARALLGRAIDTALAHTNERR
jgi:TetR/AcrR family transcriptional repressor of bet genes